MNSIEIRDAVIFLLHEYLKRPVILKEQSENRPEYPFIGYRFINLDMEKEGKGNYLYERKTQTVVTKETQRQHSISFTAYAKTDSQAIKLAEKAKDFFTFDGYEKLEKVGIIVVEVMPISSRNIFEVEDYERRYGFDIQIRTVNEKKKQVQEEICEILGLTYGN